jgi:hypothetical protein
VRETEKIGDNVPYKINPKTKGSGIICAIPQEGECQNYCQDCFFQSGRSYLEPLEENLPNMPPVELARKSIVRVNDGNDSNLQKNLVLEATRHYPDKFFNTAIPNLDFPGPVVLTVNPGEKTDKDAYLFDPIPVNLMFIRVRTNTWNLNVVNYVVDHYTSRDLPVVLTFMAYYTSKLPASHQEFYEFRKRTLNSYWCINGNKWDEIVGKYKENVLVHTCGTPESTSCKDCGNCRREYFATIQRMKEL